MTERFKYFWRRYLGWMPIQFCMVCGKPYWGGLPRWGWVDDFFGFESRSFRMTWAAWMQDYCSQECHDVDVNSLHEMSRDFNPDDDGCTIEEREEYDPLDYADDYDGEDSEAGYD